MPKYIPKIKTEGVVVIIPARSGSKGVPLKNIYPLSGYPLLAYSIAAAKLTKKVKRVIISTDSRVIAEIAKSFGAEVPFLRPPEISGDTSTDQEWVEHAINWFLNNEGKAPQYIVNLRPVAPLRDPIIVDQAIEMIEESKVATSLRSGHPCPESPFKWCLKDGSGYFRAIRDGDNNDFINLPRQSFPTVYVPNGYVDILITSYIIEKKSLYGDRMLGYVTPINHEIDVEEDFNFIAYELEQNGSVILKYLKSNFPPMYRYEK